MNSLKTVLFSILALASCMCNGMEPQSLNKALVEACLIGDLDTAGNLIEAGASVNAPGQYGNTPLHRVIRNSASLNAHETVQFLIDNKADIYADDKGKCFPVHTPLYWAIFLSKTNITKVLINNGAIFDPHSPQFRQIPNDQHMKSILNAAIKQQNQVTSNSQNLIPLIRLFGNNQ